MAGFSLGLAGALRVAVARFGAAAPARTGVLVVALFFGAALRALRAGAAARLRVERFRAVLLLPALPWVALLAIR